MISSVFDSWSIEHVRLSFERPTCSLRLIQTDRTCEDRLWDKRSFHEFIPLTERFVFAALNLVRRIMLDDWLNGRTLLIANCKLVRLMWSSTFDPSLISRFCFGDNITTSHDALFWLRWHSSVHLAAKTFIFYSFASYESHSDSIWSLPWV